MLGRQNTSEMVDRILSIVSRLLQGEALSTTQLANEWDADIQKPQRDIRKIRGYLPLEKTDDAWKLQKRAQLNEEDLQAIEIMESFVESQGAEFAARARRLLNSISEPDINTFYAKLNMEDISSHTQEVSLLESAIKEKRQITCKYAKDGRVNTIETQPLKLVNDQGYWYLVSFSPKHQCIKKYHLKSISEVYVTDRAFKVSEDIDTLIDNAINIWFSEEYDPFEVRLFVEKEHAKYFYRKPIGKTQQIEPHADGSIDVLITITHEMEVIPLIKSWMPNVMVLEPEWLVEMIEDDVKLFLEKMNLNSGKIRCQN